MDEYFGALLSSDADFFPIQRPANVTATRSTPNSATNLVYTLHPNLHKNSDTPPLNLLQSLPAQLPAS